MAVWFSPLAREVMVESCKTVYPHEGCGILVGRRWEKGWEVVRSIAVPNTDKERRHDRFEISPHDYLRVEKEAQRDGWDIIGFFHSHPDVPPFPSATDAQFAWANYLTVIVGVFGGQKVRVRAHLFEGEGKGFSEFPVYVVLGRDASLPPATEPTVDHRLELLNEVEPFVTIAAKETLHQQPSGATVLVRFTCEPALHALPKALETAGHTVLLLRWDEDGALDLFARVGS